MIIQDYEKELEGKSSSNICSSEEYQELIAKLDEFEDEKEKAIEEVRAQLVYENELLQKELIDYKDQVSSLNSSISKDAQKYDKDLAITTQQLSFKETEIESLKSQLNQERQSSKQTIDAIEKNRDDIEKLKEELEEAHRKYKESSEQEIKRLEDTLTTTQEELQDKIDELTEENVSMKNSYEFKFSENNDKIKELEQKLAEAENELKEGSKTSRFRNVEETESRWKALLEEAQQETAKLQKVHEQEKAEMREDIKEQLNHLKAMYEEEKRINESNFKETKQRLEASIRNLEEDMENKIIEKDDQIYYMEEEWSNKVDEMNSKHAGELNSYSNEMATLKNELHKYKAENEQLQFTIDKNIDSVHKDKIVLQEKVDLLESKINEKERIIQSNIDKIRRLETDLSQKTSDLSEEQVQLQSKNEKLELKISDLRKQIDEIANEKKLQELEFAKQEELLKQKVTFTETGKKDEIERLKNDLAILKERMSAQTDEAHKHLESQLESANTTITNLRAKLDQKKAEYLAVSKELSAKVPELERQNKELASEAEDAKQRLEEAKTMHKVELDNIVAQNNNQSSDIYNENKILKASYEKLKAEYNKLDQENSDLDNELQKQTMLNSERINFLTQQKETAQRDLKEATDNFEKALSQLSQKTGSERSKFESNQNLLIEAIENKYKTQLKEEGDRHKKEVADLKKLNKKLEIDVRQLKERIMQEQSKAMKTHNNDAREERLKNELYQTKQDYEQRLEKESNDHKEEIGEYRAKLEEYEVKIKELEAAHNKFDIQMESTKTHTRTQLARIQNDLDSTRQMYEELKVKYKKSKEEMEKMRKARGAKRGGLGGVERSNSNFAKGNFKPGITSYNKSVSKVQSSAGSSVSGSQKENASVQRTSMLGSKFASEDSKYISDKLGKTTSFQHLSTNPGARPLQNNSSQNHTDLINYDETKDDE